MFKGPSFLFEIEMLEIEDSQDRKETTVHKRSRSSSSMALACIPLSYIIINNT